MPYQGMRQNQVYPPNSQLVGQMEKSNLPPTAISALEIQVSTKNPDSQKKWSAAQNVADQV